MASGCCIAINHKGWLKELIDENEIGVSLSQDINKAYDKLNAYIKDPLRLVQAKENSTRLAVNQFDYNELAKEVIMVLESGTLIK